MQRSACKSRQIAVRKIMGCALRRPDLIASFATLFALVGLSGLLPRRLIVLNTSPSIAPGIYIISNVEPSAGRFAEFRSPSMAQCVFPECAVCDRSDGTVLKPIAAVPGDHIDTRGDYLVINAERVAPIQTHDSHGRPLHVWRANRVLDQDEFFVFSGRVWNSLDSRYFGPIHRSDIITVRAPLLTW